MIKRLFKLLVVFAIVLSVAAFTLVTAFATESGTEGGTESGTEGGTESGTEGGTDGDTEDTGSNSIWANEKVVAGVVGSLKRKYIVSFSTMGANLIPAQELKKGSCATEPTPPTKTGYIFEGWYKDVPCTKKFDFGTPITDSIKLYAKWRKEVCRMVMTVGSSDATVNGVNVKTDAAPMIISDRTMLPARFVAERLGASVAWDESARKVTVNGSGVKVELYIDSATAYINGVATTLDSPATIRDGRTYTPVRFVAEALGASVSWNDAAKTVTIVK